MHCDNNFCIYWANDRCVLQQISLDIRGCCKDSIYVDIAEDLLQKERNLTLSLYQQEYGRWHESSNQKEVIPKE